LEELLLQGSLLGDRSLELVLLLIHAQLEGKRDNLIEKLPFFDVGVGFRLDGLDVALDVGRHRHRVGVDIGVVGVGEVVVVDEIDPESAANKADGGSGDEA
jgi:hypothetical protein